MKYIRTKNKIYDTQRLTKHNGFLWESDVRWGKIITDEKLVKNVISQADTIEDLCDVFIVKYNSFNPIIHDTLEEIEYLNEMIKIKGYTIYAAIWIEIKLPDGTSVFKLEPQAIMNENGKLVLI